MSPAKSLPCQERLDAECFRENPTWAKRALAYRLLHLLTPKQITRRLPRGLRLALIAEGVDVPAGLALPDGTVVAPGTVLPSTWSMGDPIPPGVIITTGTVFPAGWTVSDPVPEGVTLEPGATFPAGWAPPDPAPTGLMPPVEISPAAVASGVAPATSVELWQPGPTNQTGRSSPVGGAWWFLDPFDTFEANDWTDLSLSPGSAAVVAGQLVLLTAIADGYARYRRLDTDTWPTGFTIEVSFALLQLSANLGINIRFGGHQIQFYATSSGDLQLQHSTDWTVYAVPGGHGTAQHTYKLVVTNSACSLLRDDVEVIVSKQMPTTAFGNQMYITLGNDGTSNDVRFEYFGVWA